MVYSLADFVNKIAFGGKIFRCGRASLPSRLGEAGQVATGGSTTHVQASCQTMRFIVTERGSIYLLGYVFGWLIGSMDASVLKSVYSLVDFANKIAFVGAIFWWGRALLPSHLAMTQNLDAVISVTIQLQFTSLSSSS